MKIKIRPELEIIANALKTLKDDKIIRSKNLVGDLGEYYCKELFDLKLKKPVNKGFDAEDIDGNKIEIKTRRTPKNSAKVIFKGFDFKYCYFVTLNEYFLPEYIYKIKSENIQDNITDKKGDRLSVRELIHNTKADLIYPSNG